MDSKTLKGWFTFWRLINWGLVSYLVIRAICAITWAMPSNVNQLKVAVRFMVAIAIIAYSLVNVFVWANQTDMDKQRMSSGVKLTLIAAVTIVASRLTRYILVSLNILTVPARFLPVVIWISLLAGILCFSIIKEKQMTDKKLGKLRTPPKKSHRQGKIGDLDISIEEWTG